MRRQRILVHCALCDKWIAHEFDHDCAMSPEYRARRDAMRQAKQAHPSYRN